MKESQFDEGGTIGLLSFWKFLTHQVEHITYPARIYSILLDVKSPYISCLDISFEIRCHCLLLLFMQIHGSCENLGHSLFCKFDCYFNILFHSREDWGWWLFFLANRFFRTV